MLCTLRTFAAHPHGCAARANRTRRRENCPMPVPLFDTRTPLQPLRTRLQERLLAVVDSGKFILGPEVAAFEAELAAYLGTEYAIGVANGTDAIVLLLRALGLGPGDDVVVPAFTFYASAEAIALTGARPVFCDVDPDTFCVTAETVHAALTPRTRAVLAVHLFGNIAPVGEIEALGVPVLEDAAQAAGSKLDGGPRPGALGTAATFSFFPSKNLGCFGDGGAVTTDDPDLADRVRMLRFHGSHDKETFELVGHNSRLDELQAAVLRVLLPHLDEWCDGRRAGARAYAQAGLGDLVDPSARDRWRRPGLASLRGAPPAGRRAGGGAGHGRCRGPRVLPRAGAPAARDARVRAGGAAAGHRGGRASEPGGPDEPRAEGRAGRRGGRGRPRCASGST